MNTRFKIIAAALGFAIATGAVADASAAATKIAMTKPAVTKTVTRTETGKVAKPAVKIAGRTHRIHLVRHGVSRWSVAHRLAPRVKVAHKIWIKPAAKVTVLKGRLVGVQKTAMAHRTIVKKTIIR